MDIEDVAGVKKPKLAEDIKHVKHYKPLPRQTGLILNIHVQQIIIELINISLINIFINFITYVQ